MATGGKRGVYHRAVREKTHSCFALAPVPVHFHGLPGGIGALRPALQAPLALPLQGFGAALARGLRSWRVIQGGIPAQARDHDDLVFDTGQGQRHRGKAAIDDQDQPSPRQPAAHLLHHLPDPIDTGFMPALAALALQASTGR